jgi:5'-nucleotidase
MRKISLFFVLCSLVFLASCTQQDHLTILHTNDTHSQAEPNADGEGGYARRMGILRQERQKDPNLLLLDAGDFSQGTPYFNIFRGRVEIEAMNRMQYDVVTLGNHEFDNGLDTLAAVLKEAKFAVVCANYDFSGTPLADIVKPYVILKKGGIKIGVFGLGCDPKGLITEKNFAPARYFEPYPIAQVMANTLHENGCDVVVCLSHLGTYGWAEDDRCDVELVKQTRGIDLVIGGHTHRQYIDFRVPNIDGDSVLVSQMGYSGTYLGKIVLSLDSKNAK